MEKLSKNSTQIKENYNILLQTAFVCLSSFIYIIYYYRLSSKYDFISVSVQNYLNSKCVCKYIKKTSLIVKKM